MPEASSRLSANVSGPGAAAIENAHVRFPEITEHPGVCGVSPYVVALPPFTETLSCALEGDTYNGRLRLEFALLELVLLEMAPFEAVATTIESVAVDCVVAGVPPIAGGRLLACDPQAGAASSIAQAKMRERLRFIVIAP